MMFLRAAAFNIVMFVAGTVLSLYGQVLKRRAPLRLVALGRLWARISLTALRLCCGVEIEVIGQENLASGGPVLVAAQHQSMFDTLVWLTLLPAPAYVLKRELLALPLLGSLLEPSGFIPVHREGGAPALRRMIARCRQAIAAGRQVVIFPEGTRVPAGERGVVQPGIVAVAAALGLPVVPVATDSGRYWGPRAFKKTPGRLKIKIYPPLPLGTKREAMIGFLTAIYYGIDVDNSGNEGKGRRSFSEEKEPKRLLDSEPPAGDTPAPK